MKEEDKKTSYQAPALDKGLDILEYLGGQHVARTQSDIAQALGKKPSEIYRMLACLEEREYLLKQNGAYRLSLRLFQVGRTQHELADLRGAARVPMELLSELTGQSCHVSIQYGGALLILIEQTPARRMSLAVGEGTTLPLWRTASGKVALGRMSEEERERILEQDEGFQELLPAFQERTRLIITKARKDGYLFQASEVTEGVSDIAVPIGLDGEDSAAVLALTCFDSGMVEIKAEDFVTKVCEVARSIDLGLGVAQ